MNQKLMIFPRTHQRSKVTGSTTTTNSGRSGEAREPQLRSASLKQQVSQPCRSTCTVILVSCWKVSMDQSESEKRLGRVVLKQAHFHGFYIKEHHQVLQVKNHGRHFPGPNRQRTCHHEQIFPPAFPVTVSSVI